MSISWVISTLVVTGLSLGSVGKCYWESKQWRRNQILLDNTVIEMGRNDREVINRIQSVNSQIKKLEIAHHVFHGCVRTVVGAPHCIGKDRAFEIAIRRLVSATEVHAKLEWERTTNFGKKVLAGSFKPDFYSVVRPSLRLTKQICPICRLVNRLVPVETGIHTRLYVKKAPRDLQSGYSIEPNERRENPTFNYKLVSDHAGH